jgi:hypothetical protein
VTFTPGESAELPAASHARAVIPRSLWVAVPTSQTTCHGAEVALPTSLPPTKKSTVVTPTSSDAFAVSVTLPVTVAPSAGDAIVTLGATVSPDWSEKSSIVIEPGERTDIPTEIAVAPSGTAGSCQLPFAQSLAAGRFPDPAQKTHPPTLLR